MALVNKDVLHSKNKLVYCLTSKCEKNKTMNMSINLTDGIKNLYLADEPAKLEVICCDQISKSNINDTYGCIIGSFSFDGDDLVYIRNLTGEKEEVDLNQNILLPHQLEEIKSENNKTESQLNLFNDNEYHKKARKALYDRITVKFNQLSTLIFDVLNKLIDGCNEHYELDLGYEATTIVNQLFQDAEEKLPSYSLEEQIELIKQINKLIKSTNEEIDVLKTMVEGLDIDVKSDENEDISLEDLGLDSLYGNMSHNKSHINHNNSYHHNKPLNGMPGGKILYGSPIKSLTVNIIDNDDINREKKNESINDKKKTVEFNLDKTEFHEHQIHNDE